MLIDVHPHMKRLFDLCHRAVDRNNQAIHRPVGHRKTIGLGKVDCGLVVLHRRAELFRKLRNTQELAIIRALGIIEATQKTGQRRLVAQRKNNGKPHLLRGGQGTHQRRLSTGNRWTNMIMQYLRRRLSQNGNSEQHKGRNKEYQLPANV